VPASTHRVEPLTEPPDAVVAVPGSKSITNRALVCAALAGGASTLRGIGLSDDTEAMLDAIARLGADVRLGSAEATVLVVGTAGALRPGPIELDARLAGTTSRFVTALAALGQGRYRIDGGEPLRTRPMAPLHDALVALGAGIEPESSWGHLPVVVTAGGLRGGAVALPGDISSQFVTALMLVAPATERGIQIELTSPLVSRPYLAITQAVMAAFGVDDVAVGERSVTVGPGRYRRADYPIEPDASSASYLWAAAAITGGRVAVPGFGPAPLQGDAAFVDLLGRMGARVERAAGSITVHGRAADGIDVDMADWSDTVPTLAAVASFADSPTRIRGIGFIRRKETDRIGSLVTELQRCGVDATEEDDGLTIRPDPTSLHGARVRTYDDHRMAMALALLGLRVDGIEIEILEAEPGAIGGRCDRGGLAETRQGCEQMTQNLFHGNPLDLEWCWFRHTTASCLLHAQSIAWSDNFSEFCPVRSGTTRSEKPRMALACGRDCSGVICTFTLQVFHAQDHIRWREQPR
jgi:3-phosphoshikimate 1-carboxyvinyltransferase